MSIWSALASGKRLTGKLIISGLSGEASNGEEGLAIAENAKPDIIITDIRMPFMDGLEFMEKLREAGLTSKIIVLSGYDEFDYARTGPEIWCFQLSLLKPIENQQLIETVLQVVKRSGWNGRKTWNITGSKRNCLCCRNSSSLIYLMGA